MIRIAITMSASAFLDTFAESRPEIVENRSRSGNLNFAISLVFRKKPTPADSTSGPPQHHTAHMRPQARSGTGTQATFCTAGCERIRFSISRR